MPMHYILKNSVGEYWNNSDGWTDDDEDATYYSQSQKDTMRIPSDASWIPADDEDDEDY